MGFFYYTGSWKHCNREPEVFHEKDFRFRKNLVDRFIFEIEAWKFLSTVTVLRKQSPVMLISQLTGHQLFGHFRFDIKALFFIHSHPKWNNLKTFEKWELWRYFCFWNFSMKFLMKFFALKTLSWENQSFITRVWVPDSQLLLTAIDWKYWHMKWIILKAFEK